jgi:hypothetical protein
MSWKRGTGSTDWELRRVQECVEDHDILLNGGEGEIGMVREWRDFKSKRDAFEAYIKISITVIGLVCGVPGILVALSALGVIHLR